MTESDRVDNDLNTIPSKYGRQQNRNNTLGENLQKYYKRSIIIPFLDYMCTQLDERFPEGNQEIVIGH